MEAFDYVAPRSLAEAYALLGNGKRSQFLAGGTDIIVQLRERRKSCDQLIDLKHIPDLMGFRFESDGGLSIGAATPCAELYEDSEIQRRLPGLVDAASPIGGIQIQSRASLGGNLSNASPAADSAPALMALGAQLVIGSASGQRTIPVETYFAGPGRNSLAAGEILLRIIIPAQPVHSGTYFHRFIPRNEMDIAVANVGVRIVLNAAGDRIEAARVALGAVGPPPLMAPSAAAALVGQPPNDATFAKAGEAAEATATPITDMRGSVTQRKRLVAVLTTRALQGALKRAQEAR